jgi:predicted ATP-grasp superfamily ATP-dependent carboligase
MSASFLVSDRSAELIGIGRQRMEVIDGRFAYLGGTIPAPRAGEERTLCRAVASVPGLRGFVGVDFIKERPSGKVIVLEINPRPTTSYVGLARLLPAGTLASAWIETLEGSRNGESDALARVVHACDGFTFEADGTILRVGREARS